jgi:hypothetical protein
MEKTGKLTTFRQSKLTIGSRDCLTTPFFVKNNKELFLSYKVKIS